MSANGRPKNVPGATFYLRYNRNCWEPVGKDPDAAMAAKRRREIALEGVPGVFLGGADESGTQVGNRLKIDDAIEQYLTDTRAQKEDGTYKMYKNAVLQFRESSSNATVDYGDIVLPQMWRSLGPVESIIGVLMCGLSASFLFAIVSRLVDRETKLSLEPTKPQRAYIEG
jgi:hypothetical protein